MSAKQIRFYRNGDRYFSGLKLAVSPERYKEFDSLLAELSEKVNLSTGAVRFIFNAEDNSIITDISQLYNGISYVCSSTNTFRQLEGGYGKHMYSWSVISKSKEQVKPNILGNVENFHHIAFRSESARDFIKPKLVTVIRNGKPPQKKVTLLLNSKTAVSLNQVLDQLSAKGSLGKVDKLCSVDGRGIKTLRDLFDDDTVFIALSANEKFPEDGIELDPNINVVVPAQTRRPEPQRDYRITPYRELKRPCNVNVRRANSMRLRKVKDENENLALSSVSRNGTSTSNGSLSCSKGSNAKVARPRSATRKVEQNKDELYPTSVFESDSESASGSGSIRICIYPKKELKHVSSIRRKGKPSQRRAVGAD